MGGLKYTNTTAIFNSVRTWELGEAKEYSETVTLAQNVLHSSLGRAILSAFHCFPVLVTLPSYSHEILRLPFFQLYSPPLLSMEDT